MNHSRIAIGRVSAPSGILVVLDMGYLNLWCHDRPPTFPAGLADDATTAAANAAVDLEIIGEDAEKAGRLFDRQWHPRYLYDIPATSVEQMRDLFSRSAAEHGCAAAIRRLEMQIPHRRRVDLALEHGRGAGEITFHGILAVAVAGIPTDLELTVFADEMTEDPHRGRLRSAYIECLPHATIAESEHVGYAAVDYGRLMFADADVLGDWQHDEPIDGLADYVFWGRDAARAASLTGAPLLADRDFGWLNLPAAEAAQHGQSVEDVRIASGMKFATDFRPHSHHYAVMEQVRNSPTESGTLALGDATVCGFMTRWGDGLFPVYRDLTANGHLAQIRIEIGTPDRIELMRRVEERWGMLAKMALVSNRVAQDGQPVRWLYRESADRDADSGWRVFSGDESQEYNEDAKNITLMPLQDLCELDPRLVEIFQNPIGSAFERRDDDSDFYAVEPPPADE